MILIAAVILGFSCILCVLSKLSRYNIYNQCISNCMLCVKHNYEDYFDDKILNLTMVVTFIGFFVMLLW